MEMIGFREGPQVTCRKVRDPRFKDKIGVHVLVNGHQFIVTQGEVDLWGAILAGKTLSLAPWYALEWDFPLEVKEIDDEGR